MAAGARVGKKKERERQCNEYGDFRVGNGTLLLTVAVDDDDEIAEE